MSIIHGANRPACQYPSPQQFRIFRGYPLQGRRRRASHSSPYASSWLKCWHPNVYCAALLNAQPMGFYAPAQIVRDVQEHGIEVRPICVDASRWDCMLEPRRDRKADGRIDPDDDSRFAVRLGLRMVRGLGNADAARLVAERGDAPFTSIDDLWRRARIPHAALTELAEGDAFRSSLGLSRRGALWTIKALRDEPLPLFAAAADREAKTVAEQAEPIVHLRAMPEGG